MSKINSSILRRIIPYTIRAFLFKAKPRFKMVCTYRLIPGSLIKLSSIDSKYQIRQIDSGDLSALELAHSYRGKNAFRNKVLPRINQPEWIGLGVFDTTSNKLAYIAWIVIQSIRYIEEFGIYLDKGKFLLKDGFCVPEYRHQGLHTRMEQERINYCINHGAKEIYIQIEESNRKGIESVVNNGYVFFNKKRVFYWPIFNVFREFSSFLKHPFRKIVK